MKKNDELKCTLTGLLSGGECIALCEILKGCVFESSYEIFIYQTEADYSLTTLEDIIEQINSPKLTNGQYKNLFEGTFDVELKISTRLIYRAGFNNKDYYITKMVADYLTEIEGFKRL